jgi:hypothetical protein
MRLQTASPADLCVDTDTILTAAQCAALKAFGVKGVFRYASDVSVTEAGAITSSGLTLYFVNHSRAVGWIPLAAEGTADGERDVKDLQALGVPKGAHMFFDLEGVGGGNPQAVIAHVSAWAAVVSAAGYIPALYVGEGALLTSAQLYALPVFLYWCSASNVNDIFGNAAVPSCNWSIYQGRPVDTTCEGVVVDFDSVYEDVKGRLPVGITA